MKNEMILLDETELTIGCLTHIGNELGWHIQNGRIPVEEAELRLEEFLKSVRIPKDEIENLTLK